MNFIGFLIIYGYFAFGFADNFATCYAKSRGGTTRIDEDNAKSDDVDVSSNFQFGFFQLFLMTILQAVGLVLNHIYIDKEDIRQGFLLLLVWPSVIWGLVCWCYLFVHRLSHAGEVCSGDYLGDKKDVSSEGYLIDTGLFILFIWRVICLFVIACVLAIILAILCIIDSRRNMHMNPCDRCTADCRLLDSYMGIFVLIAGAMIVFCTIVMVDDLSVIFY